MEKFLVSQQVKEFIVLKRESSVSCFQDPAFGPYPILHTNLSILKCILILYYILLRILMSILRNSK